jgi:hypothetical protein
MQSGYLLFGDHSSYRAIAQHAKCFNVWDVFQSKCASLMYINDKIQSSLVTIVSDQP